MEMFMLIISLLFPSTDKNTITEPNKDTSKIIQVDQGKLDSILGLTR